jgi:acylpyruvate hydrolase
MTPDIVPRSKLSRSRDIFMKIVAFEGQGGPRLGVVDGDQVVDLQAADPKVPRDLGEWLAKNNGDTGTLGEIAKYAPASTRKPISAIKYALPVGRPGKIICLGLNYLEHVKEGSQRDNIPKFPTIFMRGLTSMVAHGEPIVRPQVSETLDYEAELILVVGKRAKHLTADNATSCVAGYSCGNEGSVREFQRKTTQWDMGKNFDRTGGFGPWLVTADELPYAAKGLKIQSRLNGNVMQSDNTDNMMFPIAEMLVYITQGMTLEPGDVIFTGTPSGVGHARKPPVWMKNGDTIEVEIEGVGTLRNPIADEQAG